MRAKQAAPGRAHGAPNRVRIIGGQYRRRLLDFPDSGGLRPTADRVRETLFNWLGQDLTDLATLEPFAGSGVLSLEAISRGARLAVAVDRDRRAMVALGATARQWGAHGIEAQVADARTWIAAETRRFDVIFLDPPFADDPWHWLLPACTARLAAGGVVYAEAGHAITPQADLEVHRHAKAGQVHYHLLRMHHEAAP